MNEPALVIFDLVGTTVEDRDQVAAALREALAGQGLSVTPEQLVRLRGSSKREALRLLLPDGPDLDRRVEELHDAFRAGLVRRFAASGEGVRAIPGAAALFQALRRRGIRVALNTGFDRETTLFLLQSLGWRVGAGGRPGGGSESTRSPVQVDALVCGDDVARGRPAPDMIRQAMGQAGVTDPARVATVGDTVRDLQAGAAAGVRWNVGVLSGAHDRATLEAVPHTHLVGSVAELESLWTAPAP